MLGKENAKEENCREKGVTRAAISGLTSDSKSVGMMLRSLKSMEAVGMAGAGVIVAG